MIQKFDEFIKSRGVKTEAFIPETPSDVAPSKTTHDGKSVSGFKEVIEVIGLGKMKAKLDTGNTAYNAIIVQDFKEDDGKVSFEFNGEKKEYDIVKHIKIWHHGKSTERPVIKVDIKFNGKEYKDELVDLKISDLTGTKNYRSRMLLCKDFMKKANIVIDPSKEFKLTDKKELPKKKKKKVNESIWSDIQDRSSGEVERKEDELPEPEKKVLDICIKAYAKIIKNSRHPDAKTFYRFSYFVNCQNPKEPGFLPDSQLPELKGIDWDYETIREYAHNNWSVIETKLDNI